MLFLFYFPLSLCEKLKAARLKWASASHRFKMKGFSCLTLNCCANVLNYQLPHAYWQINIILNRQRCAMNFKEYFKTGVKRQAGCGTAVHIPFNDKYKYPSSIWQFTNDNLDMRVSLYIMSFLLTNSYFWNISFKCPFLWKINGFIQYFTSLQCWNKLYIKMNSWRLLHCCVHPLSDDLWLLFPSHDHRLRISRVRLPEKQTKEKKNRKHDDQMRQSQI